MIFIGICAWLHPIGDLTTATTAYQTRAFDTGFVNGYQTLDVQPGAGRNERYAGDERLCRDCFWRLWPGVVGGDL
ncbi:MULTISPECIES: branched-chain amino acid transport system II carrier protein [Citrobacter]|uniref:branched-chain amino acid transport system II carrier protein n=1 Tax=Citrobacter TaxID=544 RepID=UPI001D05B7D7|nr:MULTISPECIES: branched-chain amino acid transport system II carrier protein [Citrobacter]MDU2845094.1 branched-chain amino acid transport system II carrier protein [Citrobacter sp.]